MNYYVLYCQTIKTEKLCLQFNRKKNIHAYIPQMEKYIRSKDITILQVMFPGYLFIQTTLNQIEFDSMLYLMKEEKDGVIRELKKEDISALTSDEIQLLHQLLDDRGILVMSEGYKENEKTIVTKGPLKNLQDSIIAVYKKDRLAILNIQFLKRNIKAGIWIR